MKNSLHYFKIRIINDENFENKIAAGLSKILEQADEKNIAVEDFNDYEVLYMFIEDTKISKLENLFESNEILLESRDVTDDTLMAVNQGSDFINTFKDPSYKKMLESFLRNYLTTDMILDKILERGIESLTDLDREILENEN